MDLALGGLALIVTSPLLAAGAVSVLLDGGRPVIHRRRVVGLHGREFDAFKLRTMRVDADRWMAEHPEFQAEYSLRTKLDRDPRVTRAGRLLRRLSIDELPQLLNVLKGEMSLVGPRMIHPSELSRFGEFGAERLSVRPGITGLWQVSGRQSLPPEARIELDRRYIERRSLMLDLAILARTVPAVLSGRGAH